ncbi:class I SAM-dependent methyltransferase [Bacillus sp. CGMCC 1.16607]|uniref:class I SAM-dependent methyltransferase n=1 Tax=Bacillus sp. CGMCC 1.16607 TaxID=3351842 RepID=UPI00362A10F9
MASFNWVSEAEKQWNERANFWNKNSKEMWEAGSRKDIVPFFQKHIKEGTSVCDLGCGDGYGSFKLAQSGYHTLGIDLSEEMIEKALTQRQHQNLQFVKGDISKVKIEKGSFDSVMAINSLEWTESPLEVVKEIERIVKPNGFACIGILGPTAMPRTNSFRRLYGEEVICNTMMPWEFEQLANENGWEKVDEMPVYKRGADQLPLHHLSPELKQALSFMWVFMLKRKN